MRYDKTTKLPGEEILSRREMVKMLTAASVATSPFMARLAIARESSKNNAIRMVAVIFFESYATLALQRALRYAGDDGFVASLPQLLHARVNATYDNIIWNTWFTANSEESVITTAHGNRVVVAVHGGGIFTSPERIERSLRADMDRLNVEGLTGQYAAKISEREARNVLNGKLADGSEIPVFQFDEFSRGIDGLPRRYAVILDFQAAKKAKSGYQSFDSLKDEPILIVRAGGTGPLARYLDKAKNRNNTNLMGNWHPFDRIDPDQPQTRILELSGNRGGTGSEGNDLGLGWGYDADYGISGTGGFTDIARYVAVAPRNVSAGLRYLDFGV